MSTPAHFPNYKNLIMKDIYIIEKVSEYIEKKKSVFFFCKEVAY
jgi:hypothetical protein